MTDLETKAYYDDFSRTIMLKYFRQVNSRIEGVKDLCDRYILDNSKILEVGCGVGILTKFLQTRARQVVAVEISETGLGIARAYAKQGNTKFLLLNLLENSQPIEEYGPFDVIIMADVIEHIPKEEHQTLFELFERMLTSTGKVILTFPNSHHQNYLSENEPDKLQIIDETISIREILAATKLHPLSINFYNADGKNKYIHIVLSVEIDYLANNLSTSQKVIRRIRNFLWAARNRRFINRIREELLI